MTNLDITGQLLTYIVAYGALALGVVVMLAAAGAPLPSTVFVMACGAFVQQGVLEPYSTLAVAFGFVVLGDTFSYGIGRGLSRRLSRRYTETETWVRAETYFQRRGAIAIFLTRCVLTPIAIPINLIAGSTRYSFPSFVWLAAAGELVWLLAFGALGYVFGSQWEIVSEFISNFMWLLVGLAIVAAGAYWLLARSPAAAEEVAPVTPTTESPTVPSTPASDSAPAR